MKCLNLSDRSGSQIIDQARVKADHSRTVMKVSSVQLVMPKMYSCSAPSLQSGECLTSGWFDARATSHVLKAGVSERLRPSSVTSDNPLNAASGGQEAESENKLL